VKKIITPGERKILKGAKIEDAIEESDGMDGGGQ
jgi:hypothetical protein